MGEPFFKDVPDLGKNPGLFIWRIEKLAPVLQSGKHTLGKFHTGDSYIILSIVNVKNSLKMNIHFWLGAESSQDERGAAAILTAELDQRLGDLPVQFREVQGSESKEFIQLFPNGIQYVEGGVESAFKKVEHDVYETRLLQIKGRRNVRVIVCKVDVSSLNSGDVFILDTGLTLYQWNGKEAHRAEKSKALDVVLAIKDEERGGRAKIVAINEDEQSDSAAAFFQALGFKGSLANVKIKDAAEGGSDDAPEVAGGPIKLYEAQDPKGQQWNLIEQRPFVKSMLKSESSFVFLGGGIVYAWVGKSCRADVRKNIITLALAFAKRNNMPETTPIKVVKEGAEPPLFKQMFKEWDKPHVPRVSSIETMSPKQREKAQVDIEALIKRSKEDDDVPVDDGSGELTIWRVENFQRAAWPRDLYGQFYSGDSYIVLYKYKENGRRDAAIIYFWQGRDSSQDEKASSALLAKQLDDEMGGYPVQVRVVQGKEPNHFFMLFKGRMVVHHGGKASAFKNVKEASEEAVGKQKALYHVRGTNDKNTHACQTVLEAASLNSGDCFILIVPHQRVFLWEGKYSSPTERKFAHGVMASLAHEANVTAKGWITVQEGNEPDEFWEDLGGKGEYPAFVEGGAQAQEPRLFQICDAQVGGAGVKVEEIFNFSQDDLCEDDIMMLDTNREVFLWIGRGANENEKAEAQNVAAKYVEAAVKTDGRDPDTPVMKVSAGNEPTLFTCHFHGWDSKKAAAFVDPYEAKLAKIKAMRDQKEEKAAGAAPGTPTKGGATPGKGTPFSTPTAAGGAAKAATPEPVKVATPAGSKVIPYEELINMRLEDGIAPDLKETYLSEDEFKKVFGMDRDAFVKMPKWKQADAKRKVRLF